MGAELPPELAPYDPPPYTLERFLEDELNDKPRPLPLARPMTPRDQQCDGADVVAAHAAAGGRVFLLGDDPGVGKTGTAILAVKAIAEQRDVRTVLVVADRPAAITIPHWTRSIAGFGDGGLRWCVTTWDRLAKVAKLTFDVVVADEAHMVRHTTTQRWKHWKAVSGAGRVKDAPFVLAATATPAHTPARAALPGARVRRPARRVASGSGPTCPTRLAAHGFHVERGRYGWQWTEDADERRADLARLQGWLADADPPATLHRPAPWGPGLGDRHAGRARPRPSGPPTSPSGRSSAPRCSWPGARGRARRAGRRCCGSGRRPGLIRVQATVDWVKAQVEAERQVAVSVEFVETAADPIREALLDSGIPVAGIYGRDRFDVEAERLRFQRGEAMVCVLHRDRLDQPARRRAAARRARAPPRPRGSGCSTSRGSPASRPVRSPAAPTATGAPRRGGSRSPRTPSRSRSPG